MSKAREIYDHQNDKGAVLEDDMGDFIVNYLAVIGGSKVEDSFISDIESLGSKLPYEGSFNSSLHFAQISGKE
jgi:hypothetical protein